MNEILANLAQPSWWLSVLVAGFVVNLLAAYAKPPLDRILSRMSDGHRAASEAKRSRFKDRVIQLCADAEERAHLRARQLEARVDELAAIMWATSMYVISGWFPATGFVFSIVGLLATLGAIGRMSEADRLRTLLEAAHQRREPSTPSPS